MIPLVGEVPWLDGRWHFSRREPWLKMEHRSENGEAGTPVVFKSALNSMNTTSSLNISMCDF